MKIKSIHIKNFRSHLELDMDEVGDLVILVGGNSSGKTNIIDALTLFFNELTPEIQRNIGSIPDYTWFDRDMVMPVTFDITIELNKEDTNAIFTEDVRTELKKETVNYIRLIREIKGDPNAAIWVTELVEVNNRIVYKPTTEIEAQAQPDATAEVAGKVLSNLTARWKGKFVFIQTGRDMSVSYTGLSPRQTIISSTLLTELRTLAQKSDRDTRRKWQSLERFVRAVSPHVIDMRVLDGDFTLRERDSDNSFPVQWVGGGYQELLMLIYQLIKQPDAIFGIDEPELHLHPGLARKFLDILKDISSRQQLFLATQSPIFVDRSDLSNVWLVKKIKDVSRVTRLQEVEDLSSIVLELDIRPSDIFYSNIVVFVEGPSDRAVLPTLAQKMGLNFESGEVSFIPTYGKSQGKYHLNTFIESTKAANIPYFMILDKGAGKETKDFVKKGVLILNNNLFFLTQGDLEDYYPREKLIDTVCSEYNIELTPEEKKRLQEGAAVESIEVMLKQKLKRVPIGWKTVVGRRVAESMGENEINEEIKRIIERIARKAGLL